MSAAIEPGWVELRVHGVSGTPPESMLASAQVCQVAGDDRSRCFRPTDAQGHEVRADDGHVVEAFHWGRWTSGSWTQALWVLLIPFGMANAAQFMLPSPHGRGPRFFHAASGAVLRLLALVLTALFTIGVCVLLVDLVAWQWLARMDLPGDDRLVVWPALLLAVGAVYGLSFLGRSRAGRRRYGAATEARGLPGLGDTAFFDGDPDSPSLRHLHRAAALFLIALIGVSAVAGSRPMLADLGRWAPIVGLAGTVAVVFFLGDPERTTTVARGGGSLRHWWHGISPSGEAGAENPPSQLVAAILHLLGLVAALSAALAIAVAPVSRGELPGARAPLPGIENIAASVGIGGTVVTLLLFSTVFGLALTTRHEQDDVPDDFRRFARGLTAWLAAAVGFFVGIGLTAGLSLTVQGVLNRLQGSPSVSAPLVLQRVSFTWGVTAAVIVLLLICAGVRLWLRRKDFLEAAKQAYTFGPPGPASSRPRLHPTWLRRVGRAMRIARLKNHLQGVFWTFGVVGTVLALTAATDYLVERLTEDASNAWLTGIDLFTGVSSPAGQPIVGDDIVIGIGQVTLLGLAGGAVLLTRGAIKAEGPRRALNVVWDVIAFWPRAVHPFVPPPYSQEVVPALVRRICWHLGEPDPLPDTGAPDTDDDPVPHPSAQDVNPHPVRLVVLAAHSQGSLISLAALLRLPREVRGRVRWLTFGSQLRQQFPRAFPHYVRFADLEKMQVRHSWLSLYRDTDPIAGPVTSWDHECDGRGRPVSVRLGGSEAEVDAVDPATGRRTCGREWRLLDPPASDWRFQTSAVDAIRGHSDYWLDPQWDEALLAVRVPVPPAGPTPSPARAQTPAPVSAREPTSTVPTPAESPEGDERPVTPAPGAPPAGERAASRPPRPRRPRRSARR